jgi:hypothetical protein
LTFSLQAFNFSFMLILLIFVIVKLLLPGVGVLGASVRTILESKEEVESKGN